MIVSLGIVRIIEWIGSVSWQPHKVRNTIELLHSAFFYMSHITTRLQIFPSGFSPFENIIDLTVHNVQRTERHFESKMISLSCAGLSIIRTMRQWCWPCCTLRLITSPLVDVWSRTECAFINLTCSQGTLYVVPADTDIRCHARIYIDDSVCVWHRLSLLLYVQRSYKSSSV